VDVQPGRRRRDVAFDPFSIDFDVDFTGIDDTVLDIAIV
jgi:hypothetical protein